MVSAVRCSLGGRRSIYGVTLSRPAQGKPRAAVTKATRPMSRIVMFERTERKQATRERRSTEAEELRGPAAGWRATSCPLARPSRIVGSNRMDCKGVPQARTAGLFLSSHDPRCAAEAHGESVPQTLWRRIRPWLAVRSLASRTLPAAVQVRARPSGGTG